MCGTEIGIRKKFSPGDLEYPEKAERTQNADAKGGTRLNACPDYFYNTTYYHLKNSTDIKYNANTYTLN